MDSALGRPVDNPPENIAEHWNVLKETVYHTAHNILGKVKCKHPDWFDQSDQAEQAVLHAKNSSSIPPPKTKLDREKACFFECKISFAEGTQNHERQLLREESQGVVIFC